jgi:hypothetical protein
MSTDTDNRTVPLTLRVTSAEAEKLRDLMWRSRQRLSSWLRETALREAARLERRQQS